MVKTTLTHRYGCLCFTAATRRLPEASQASRWTRWSWGSKPDLPAPGGSLMDYLVEASCPAAWTTVQEWPRQLAAQRTHRVPGSQLPGPRAFLCLWAQPLEQPPPPTLRGSNDDKEKNHPAQRHQQPRVLMCPLGRGPKPGHAPAVSLSIQIPEILQQDSEATPRVAHRGPANIYSASKAQSSGFFLIRPQLPLVFSHLKCNCFWATHRLAGTPEQVPVHSPRPPSRKSTCKGSPSICPSSH